MTRYRLDYQKYKADIKKMRWVLIIFTLIELGYVAITFIKPALWVALDEGYQTDLLIYIANYSLAGIYIWYNWKRMPISRKAKQNNTWMMLFLGIIGMWLWIPSDKEIHGQINHFNTINDT